MRQECFRNVVSIFTEPVRDGIRSCLKDMDMERKSIISFGDSVMKGIVTGRNVEDRGRDRYMISDSGFTSLCARRLGVQIENYGKFGNTVTGGMRDVSRHQRQLESSEYALMEFGGNDCNYDWNAIAADPSGKYCPQTSLDTFRLTYESIISKVREAGCIPVMLSLPPIDSLKFFSYICSGFCTEQRNNVLTWLGGSVNTIGNWHEMYNLELYRIAASQGVRLIDITTCFLSRRDFSSLFCDDGMHPNETGHRLISDAVCAALPFA